MTDNVVQLKRPRQYPLSRQEVADRLREYLRVRGSNPIEYIAAFNRLEDEVRWLVIKAGIGALLDRARKEEEAIERERQLAAREPRR